jgi:hypothetical protein
MSEREDRHIPSARPVTAMAEDGAVLLDGPHGTVFALTPAAAVTTSENLRRAAEQAVSQSGGADEPVPFRPRD